MAGPGSVFRPAILLLALNAICVTANDILGCGGFIKSHVDLDFSKVEIKLLTKQGSLKEKTECAPTNGYYFLPLYEHGEYVLKVDPPPGWSIEPSEIPLNVDGISDPCSKGQDVNFAFTGFGITGRVVTAGSSTGPTGVSVHLVSKSGESRETKTKFNGDFHFTPVIPGTYTLRAYHPKWKLDPSSTTVEVSGGNTALKVGTLAVRGYDVRGTVTSNGKPISGIHVVLYSAKGSEPRYKIEGCITALLQDVPDDPICYSVTGDNGEFTFGLVPAGEYKLIPLERQLGKSKTIFNLQPGSVNFKVEHDSVNLKNAFEVTGFSVKGLVVERPGGNPMQGAKILLDRKPVGVTEKDGKYTLSNLRVNTYTLQVIADGCEFDDATISISARGDASVPDIYPARWKVCGTVRSPGSNNQRRSIVVQSAPPSSITLTAITGDDDRWCLFLSPGNYLASVQVSDEDRRDGLQYFPLSQKINVGFKPLDGITFSQLKATLTGTIKCMKDSQHPSCLNVMITLRPLSVDGSYIGQSLSTIAKDGKYTFQEILPGSYEISVPSETLCWSSTKHNIVVTNTEAVIPEFVHTGYAVSFTMSHKSKVLYSMELATGNLDIPSGLSQHCLPAAGEYVFTPSGCHTFEPPTVTYHTRQANNMVTINAVSHSVGVSIHSNDAVEDLMIMLMKEKPEWIGPLKPLPHKLDGMFVYHYTMMLPPGKSVQVMPFSEVLLFNPPGGHSLSASGGDCVDVGLLFTAAKGKVLSGQIVPPIAGVTIILDGGEKELIQVTTEDGKYHFGPLDSLLTYELHAEKESYILSGPDDNGDFQAHKLAEIKVKVIDNVNMKTLQGALVSVSGGSYRKNLVVNNDGELIFPSLAPGEYYLKPLMKEYRFTPPNFIIDVTEGEVHEVSFGGIRVACSGVGHVVTLGGNGLGGVTVIAEPTSEMDPSQCPYEEGIAERETGAFRIRGLLRNCNYKLKLKSTHEMSIAHVIPSHIDLKIVSEAEDIDGLRFIAVQPLLVTDVTVLVYTSKIEHYKTLKLRLGTEVEPTSNIFSSKLDASGYASGINPGLMITFPRLPADNRTYVIQLDSSLSRSTFNYNVEPIYFNADGKYKHFRINFEPMVKVSEQDLNQPSILILILFGMLTVAFFNQEKVLSIGLSLFGSISEKIALAAAQNKQNNAKNNQYTLDDNQIDQIVQNINSIKKKPKPRKI